MVASSLLVDLFASNIETAIRFSPMLSNSFFVKTDWFMKRFVNKPCGTLEKHFLTNIRLCTPMFYIGDYFSKHPHEILQKPVHELNIIMFAKF